MNLIMAHLHFNNAKKIYQNNFAILSFHSFKEIYLNEEYKLHPQQEHKHKNLIINSLVTLKSFKCKGQIN